MYVVNIIFIANRVFDYSLIQTYKDIMNMSKIEHNNETTGRCRYWRSRVWKKTKI